MTWKPKSRAQTKEKCRRCGAMVNPRKEGTFGLWYLPYHKNPQTGETCSESRSEAM
jgi:hypothetical protein